jgi:two-component system, NarL family, nitrate/nitrite response regulator NarL
MQALHFLSMNNGFNPMVICASSYVIDSETKNWSSADPAPDRQPAGAAGQLIGLLVVDDHALFRRGLVALLSQDGRFEVTGQAGNMDQALHCVERHRPDLILLDNHLPGGVSGVDGIAPLKGAAPGARILMLTVSEDENDLAAALKAGADGYLLKTVELDHLAHLIVQVLAGQSVISPEMLAKRVTGGRPH